jgi:hypothetical protein
MTGQARVIIMGQNEVTIKDFLVTSETGSDYDIANEIERSLTIGVIGWD